MSPARFLPEPISTSVPTMLRTICWQKASASIQKWSRLAVPLPAGFPHPAHERDRCIGPPAERGEVVLADERIGTQPEQLDFQRPIHVPRSPGPERIGPRRRQERVPVAPADGGPAGVEVGRNRRHLTHRDLGPEHRVQRPLHPLGVERARRGRRRTPPGRGHGRRRRCARHRSARRDGGGSVRVPRSARRRRCGRPRWPRSPGKPSRRRQPSSERGSAAHSGPPIGDPREERASHDQTSSIRAMSALSPWRGPSLRIRV